MQYLGQQEVCRQNRGGHVSYIAMIITRLYTGLDSLDIFGVGSQVLKVRCIWPRLFDNVGLHKVEFNSVCWPWL